LGLHKNPQLQLLFPESRQWIGRGIGHIDLLNNPEVCKTIKRWLA